MATTISGTSYTTGVALTNPATSNPVTILAGAVVTNPAGAAVSGAAGGDWTIGNAGSVQATGTGAGSYGIVLDGGGTITNADGALIAGYQMGVLMGAGTVVNAGSIGASRTIGPGFTTAATTSAFIPVDGGVVMPGGLVSNTSSGVITDFFFGVAMTGLGTVINQGLITAASTTIGFGVLLTGGGTVDNAGGVLTGALDGILGGNGAATTVINSGSIGGAGRAGVDIFGGGGVSNTAGGTISGGGYGVLSRGTAAGVTVLNQGSIGGGTRAGVYLTGVGAVTNSGSAALISSSEVGAWLVGGGAAYNSGSISGADAVVVQGAGGSITNAAAGVLSGTTIGAYVGNGVGSITNLGHIAAPIAVEERAGGSVVNGSGATIVGVAFGVLVTGGAGTVNNTGSIAATEMTPTFPPSNTFETAGVYLIDGGSVTNNLGGTITSKWIGVQLGSHSTSPVGTLVNNGYVFASDGVDGAAAWLRGTGTIDNEATGTIAGGPFGVVTYYHGVTVINAGSIFATADGIDAGGGGVFLNSGRITTSATAGSGGGIILGGAAMVTNTSSGRIAAGTKGVSFLGTTSGSTLINTGTIIGGSYAVYTAAGLTERVIVNPGAVFTGTVSGDKAGSAATSVLELGSAATAGAINGFGAHYIGFGEVILDAGATWSLAGTIASSQTLDFAGTGGLLTLANPGVIAGDILGFDTGDTIVLAGVTGVTSATLDGGNLLTVSNGSGPVLTLQFDPAQHFNDTSFGTSTVGAGTALVAPCFAEGTRIRAGCGELGVEELRAGDRVETLRGPARIVWLGHRHVDCRRHPRPQDVWPVRVARGAFGPGLPARELRLSPDHAVYANGSLIPIRYLLNGATVVQEEVDAITYWHVELAAHGVIFAEGLPTESYLDTGNRNAFANASGVVALRPDFALRVWEAESCAPLLRDGPALAAARTALLNRAAALGHVATDDPGLLLAAGSCVFSPDITGRTRRFRLPPGAGGVRLLSRSAVPAQGHADSQDHRRLGVAIAHLRLDGQPIALTDFRLSSGWHDMEPDATWRWTDGDAGLALAGVSVLEFELVLTERYWASEPGDRRKIAV